jgi:hypothetical protein
MVEVTPQFVRQGLLSRGLPAHIAEGFVMNIADESGFNAGINEVRPTVPGSRGGFGLYQLTGPRRVAFEQFATQRGVPASDPDAQLDFLVSELQGPEARAARSIFSAQDAPTAATAIARDFLRPAPENLERRVARYTGGTTLSTRAEPMRQPTMMQGQGQPMQQDQQPGGIRGLLSNPDFFDSLAIGFGGLTLNPNTAAMQMSADRIAGRAQAREDTASTNRTVEYLRSQGRDDLADAVASGSLGGRDAAAILFQPAAERGQILSAEQMRQMFPGAQIEDGLYNLKADGTANKVGGGGTVVNVGGESAPAIGTIPPGYQAVQDPQTGRFRFEPIEGGPVAEEQEAAVERDLARDVQRARAGSTVIQDLQRAVDLLPELGALAQEEGVIGGVTRRIQADIPGSVANRITQFTESALSNVGLDTLQQMRDNSPTGGALGQVPIQQQQRLEQVLGSLNINQPPSVLDANIKRVMNIYTDIIYGAPEERARSVQNGTMTPQQSAEIDSFYYELPFDERGRPVGGEPADGQMTDEDLLQMYLGGN